VLGRRTSVSVLKVGGSCPKAIKLLYIQLRVNQFWARGASGGTNPAGDLPPTPCIHPTQSTQGLYLAQPLLHRLCAPTARAAARGTTACSPCRTRRAPACPRCQRQLHPPPSKGVRGKRCGGARLRSPRNPCPTPGQHHCSGGRRSSHNQLALMSFTPQIAYGVTCDSLHDSELCNVLTHGAELTHPSTSYFFSVPQ